MRGRKGTGAFGEIAKGLGHKQIAARVRRKHVEELYKMLATEKMSFNRFVEICVEAYIKSDPRIRGLVESARRQDALPAEPKRRFAFSDHEKDELLREIEMGSILDDEDG